MKLSKSAAGILSARYKSVLIKCLLANLMLFSLPAAAETIPNGTYANETFDSPSDGSYLIEGGTFTRSKFYANDNITISGGTLTNSSFRLYDDLIINGGKIEGTLSVGISPDISIDSDAAVVNLTWDKTSASLPSSIRASSLNITGERGIFVSNTAFSSLTTSGKITANSNSFLGLFYGTGDYVYHIGGKTLHTASTDYFAPDQTRVADFSNANIVLNGDSVAGSGYYSMSSDVFVPRPIPTSYPKDAGGQTADNAPLQLLREKLTQDEFNATIKFIRDDVNNASSYDKLTNFTKAVLNILRITSSVTDLKNDEIFKQEVTRALTSHYADFNYVLERAPGTNVIISNNSTFELNDNAKLINDSFSSDYGAGPASLPTGSITTFKAGNIGVKDSTVIANGNNELSARSGNVIFQNSTLKVAKDAVLTFSSAGGALLLDSGSTLDLAGKMKGNVFSDADATVIFESSNALLDGTLSGAANAVFNADYALSNLNRSNNFEFRNIAIMDGKTLDIGTTALKADKISGGTISAILTDAAQTTPIITAAAENVTIKLNMSAASSAQTTLYHITNRTGFKLGDYSTSRYAVSSTPFTVAEASKVGVLSNWSGGDLYILRLGGSTAPIIDDLENNGGIKVHPVIEKASQILDLDDKSLDSLTKDQLDALDKIDDLLAKFDRNPEKKYQILREVSPDLSKFVSMTDESTAKRIMHAVSSRFNTPASRQISPYSRGGYYYRRMHGRSGGDFEAGQGAVWAQGLYNHAEQRGKEGFSSDSAGFAAGIEAYVSDAFKAGFGYSYAATSIDADRSDTDVYTHTGFAYAHYQPERFYTNFFAGVGHSSYEDTTKIAKLESDYQTNTISAQIAVGYAAPVLSPEAALRVINTHQKAYTDALGAELEAKSSVTATAVGGFRLSKRYRLRANTAASFVPELKAAVSYDFARSNQNRTAVLPNGASYVVETEKDKRFGVEAGAGFSFGFEKIGSLSLMYDGMFQGKLQSHSVLLNMKINL